MPSFAATVKEARKARRLTQTKFAHAVGVSLSTIYEVERGSRPDEDTVRKLAKYLGQKPTDLLPPEAVFSRGGTPREKRPVRLSDPDRLAHQDDPAKEGPVSQETDDEGIVLRLWRGLPARDQEEVIDDLYRRRRAVKRPPTSKAAGKV